ncbi:hypothetical protein TeGR_g9669 [Tetraparma gracilis]|uniref:Peptidase M14 domain-containing protein n=1 Tax=Tetraparma gracilis TaxID=2962635 RepID=A0ABQ6MC09_9STRA|nr:hypothetical protein TeGR_g9669 [Tetraparma gracilis]
MILTPSAPTITLPADAGAILVNSVDWSASSPSSASFSLSLKPEKCLEGDGTFKQWFAFTAGNLPTGENGSTLSFTIEDAGSSTFPDWSGYKVCWTNDMENWGRIPSTSFDAETGKLSWSVHDNTDPLLTFAYFPTYSLERQERLVHSAALSGHCQHKVLGETVDKRPLHALLFNKHVKAENPKTIWVQHRQHPGEVSASWFCDGVVERLCAMSRSSPPSRLLQNAIVLVVPNVNPDGGVRGHLRTNAVGANLNRCWGRLHGINECAGQTDPPAPEVEAMIAGMRELGHLDVMLDIHQDEEKPYVFISKTPLGVPSCTPELRKRREKFHEVLRRRSSCFETPGPVDPVGYPEPAPGKANLNICSAAVAEAFPGCLSMTMEHPYKGNDNGGEKDAEGFRIDQCVQLGKDTIDAVEEVLAEWGSWPGAPS